MSDLEIILQELMEAREQLEIRYDLWMLANILYDNQRFNKRDPRYQLGAVTQTLTDRRLPYPHATVLCWQ